MHPDRRWVDTCLLFIKAASIASLVASLVYLGTSGTMYAVSGAVFDQGQLHGTMVLIAWLIVLFGLFFSAGLLGLRLTYDPVETRPFVIAMGLTVAVVFVGMATSYFGVREAAFDIGFIGGLNLMFTVLGIAAIVLAIQVELFNREAASDECDRADDTADAPRPASACGAVLAAGSAPAERVGLRKGVDAKAEDGEHASEAEAEAEAEVLNPDVTDAAACPELIDSTPVPAP